MKTVVCPVCGVDVEVEDSVKVGDVINCPVCGVDLKITSIDPLTAEEA